MPIDLSSDPAPDLALVDLDYEGFRQLARNTHLSAHERIGFPDHYRDGLEAAIFGDIRAKLPAIDQKEKVIVDIGPGCAGLPYLLMELCARQGHRLVLVDSPEMLEQLPDGPDVEKIAGRFPDNVEAVRTATGGFADAVLCYSVLQYMFVDTNLFDAIDRMGALLRPGGRALIGDIPNSSKRRRFFGSETGRAFHREFMQTDKDPTVTFLEPDFNKINDAVLNGLVQRAHEAGWNAYVVPQAGDLPFSNRRDDLIIERL
jgi:hypothetical protein